MLRFFWPAVIIRHVKFHLFAGFMAGKVSEGEAGANEFKPPRRVIVIPTLNPKPRKGDCYPKLLGLVL